MTSNFGGWMHYTNPDECVPINDLRPHTEGATCWCKPLVFHGQVEHQALDGREDYELGILLPH
jgi:hypothetical protein